MSNQKRGIGESLVVQAKAQKLVDGLYSSMKVTGLADGPGHRRCHNGIRERGKVMNLQAFDLCAYVIPKKNQDLPLILISLSSGFLISFSLTSP
jgi:hypothetical protein